MGTILEITIQIPGKSLKTDAEYPVPEVLKNDLADECVNCTTLPNIKVNENIDWESRGEAQSVLRKHYIELKRPEFTVTKLLLGSR